MWPLGEETICWLIVRTGTSHVTLKLPLQVTTSQLDHYIIRMSNQTLADVEML